jgi:hypothetical protein
VHVPPTYHPQAQGLHNAQRNVGGLSASRGDTSIQYRPPRNTHDQRAQAHLPSSFEPAATATPAQLSIAASDEFKVPTAVMQPVLANIPLSQSDQKPAPIDSTDVPIEQISIVSPTVLKAQSFIAVLTEHFKNNPVAVTTFEQLCTAFNQKVIEPQDFYASVYSILLHLDSLHLLPGFLAFLPPLWRETDLTWLNSAIETKFKDAVDNERGRSPSSEQSLPRKRLKKRPINGFTTHSSDSDTYPSTARSASQSLYINPAALTKFSGPHPLPDRWTSSESAEDEHEETEVSQRRMVTLQIGKKNKSTVPKTPPAKRKYNRKISKSSAGSATPATPNIKSGNLDLSSTPLTRKGRYRYGEHYASEIPHFGHYPTRRAVLSRASRPYIHLVCGQGFAHPYDVKDHHSNTTGKKGGSGCVAKIRDKKQKKLEWDAHPSCKIGYPVVNYTKVKDGYILLDLESAEKIESAVQAGLAYRKDEKMEEASEQYDSGEEDAEHENEDDERIDSAMDEDAEHDVEMTDAPDASPIREVSAGVAQFGLRKMAKMVSYGGM